MYIYTKQVKKIKITYDASEKQKVLDYCRKNKLKIFTSGPKTIGLNTCDISRFEIIAYSYLNDGKAKRKKIWGINNEIIKG